MKKSVLLAAVAVLAVFTGFRPAAGPQVPAPTAAAAAAGISPKAIVDVFQTIIC